MTPSTTLFVFDLDATVTECEILPCLAEPLGLVKEMAELTARTISGQMAFEPSLRYRFDILKSLPLAKIHAIIENIPLQKDIVSFIQKKPEACIVVTGNIGIWIEPIAKKLGCKVIATKADYTLTSPVLCDITNKEKAITSLRKEYMNKDTSLQVVAIGDGAGDIPMFLEADIGIAYAGVHPLPASVTSVVDYIVKDGPALIRMLNSMAV